MAMNLEIENTIKEASLEELGAIIRDASNAVSQHLFSALEAALIAGKALIAARKLFHYDRKTGGFRGWLDDQNISRPTAYRYIKLAEHSDIVSNAETFTEAFQLIGKLNSKDKTEKASQLTMKKIRPTLTLKSDSYNKLIEIAEREGINYSEVIESCVNQWLETKGVDLSGNDESA